MDPPSTMLDPGLLDLMVLVHGKAGGFDLWFVSSPCDLGDGSPCDLDGSIPQEGVCTRSKRYLGFPDILTIAISVPTET